MFRGLAFTKDSATTSAFTPLSLNNLIEWWSADTGVDTTGSSVNSWLGKKSAYSFYPKNASYKANYISSESSMNNNPVVYINPNDDGNDNPSYLAGTFSGNNNYMSIIAYVEVEAPGSEDALITAMKSNPTDTNNRVSLITHSDYLYVYSYSGIGNSPNAYYASTGVSSTSNTKLLVLIELFQTTDEQKFYVSTTSNFNLTNTPSYSSKTTTSTDYKGLGLGYYYGIVPSTSFKIGDLIWLNGIMTSQEKSDLASWYGTKYNF